MDCPTEFAPGFGDKEQLHYLLNSKDCWLAIQSITLGTGKGIKNVADMIHKAVLSGNVALFMDQIGVHVGLTKPRSKISNFLDIVDCAQTMWWKDELDPYVKWFRSEYIVKEMNDAE